MPRHSDQARYGRGGGVARRGAAWHGVAWRGAARRVAQRDLRFNNVSLTYALAFLASFVSSCLSRSSYLSLSLVPFLGLVSFAFSLSLCFGFFLLSPFGEDDRTAATRRREDAERKSCASLRRVRCCKTFMYLLSDDNK